MGVRVSNYLIVSFLSDNCSALISHGITGAMDKVSSELGVLLERYRGRELPADEIDEVTFNHLLERGHLSALTDEQEKKYLSDIASRLRASGLSGKIPSVAFVPTYQCNLRCFYCFQPHAAHAGKGKFNAVITTDQISQAFAVIDSLSFPGALAAKVGMSLGHPISTPPPKGGTYVDEIGLFGGEPLTASTRSAVECIAAHARERGAHLWAITNGVELDHFFHLLGCEPGRLRELQITIDGAPEHHNMRRKGPELRSTFDHITRNVEECLKREVSVNIRMNTDFKIVEDIEWLATFFREKGWEGAPRFKFSCAVVTSDSGAPNPSWSELIDRTSLASDRGFRVHSYEHFAREFFTNSLRSSGGRFPHTKTANCAAEEGQLMFDCFGDVYGCWEDVSFVEHRIGTYGSNGLSLDARSVQSWFGRHPGMIEECSSCPYALIHTSGCGAQARARTGTIMKNECAEFQSYFPKSLAREYEKFEAGLLKIAEEESVNAEG